MIKQLEETFPRCSRCDGPLESLHSWKWSHFLAGVCCGASKPRMGHEMPVGGDVLLELRCGEYSSVRIALAISTC